MRKERKKKRQSKEVRKEIRRILWNGLYILLTISVIVGFGLLDRNVGNFFHELGSLKLGWVLGAAGAMLMFWVMESGVLHYITSFIFKGFGYLKAFRISMIGVYYSALTPFSSGGQPMQVMHMRRDNVPVGKSSSAFCIKFITFEFVICGFFIINLLFKGTQYFANYREIFWLTCFGFAINAALAVIVILALTSKGKLVLFGTRLVHFLHRIHLVKHAEKTIIAMSEQLEDFHTSGIMLRTNAKLLFGSIALTAVQMFALFTVTFCIYRSMGLNDHSLLDVVSMQAYLYLTVSFVPLPGAAFASEGGFYLFFAMFFPSSMMFLAMLMWRFFTYYANIIFGSLFVLYDAVRNIFARRNRLKTANQ